MVRSKKVAAGIGVAILMALTAPGAPASERKAAAGKKASRTRQAAKDSSESRFIGEPISLDVKDADLKDVLRTFAELEKLNIAIDPEVRGSVTIRLENVPWNQALELILETNGLGYVLEGNVLRVGKPEKLLPHDWAR